jgi:hypothetical protein
LKGVYKLATGLDGPEQDLLVVGEGISNDLDRWSSVPTPRKENSHSEPESVNVNQAVFEACCCILERLLRPLDDTYLDDQDDHKTQTRGTIGGSIAVTALEWELVSGFDLYTPGILGPNPPEPVDGFLRDKEQEGGRSVGRHKEPKKVPRGDIIARERALEIVRKMTPLTPTVLQVRVRVRARIRVRIFHTFSHNLLTLTLI